MNFFAFIFLIIIIIGCAPQKKIYVKKDVENRQFERLLGPREAAVQRYGHKGIEEIIITESPIITPAYAKPGDLIRQELQYTIFSQHPEDRFIVSEIVVISIEKEYVELLRRQSEKEQGIHLSVVQITLPQDLKPGEYTLTTTISSGDTSKTVTGSFTVKR